MLNNKTSLGVKSRREDKVLVKKGAKFSQKKLDSLNFELFSLKTPCISGEKTWEKILSAFTSFNKNLLKLDENLESDILKLKEGDQLQPGILKLAKVYLANKRKNSIGDKIAARHGNKGVISKIVPVEDMPYMKNRKPVDVVLNPLGVPSRMNVGQILETHLGWACAEMGDKISQLINKHNDTRNRDELVHGILRKVYG